MNKSLECCEGELAWTSGELTEVPPGPLPGPPPEPLPTDELKERRPDAERGEQVPEETEGLMEGRSEAWVRGWRWLS